jgi:hypothetical protein
MRFVNHALFMMTTHTILFWIEKQTLAFGEELMHVTLAAVHTLAILRCATQLYSTVGGCAVANFAIALTCPGQGHVNS